MAATKTRRLKFALTYLIIPSGDLKKQIHVSLLLTAGWEEQGRGERKEGERRENPWTQVNSQKRSITPPWKNKIWAVTAPLKPLHPVLGCIGISVLVAFNEPFFSILNLAEQLNWTYMSPQLPVILNDTVLPSTHLRLETESIFLLSIPSRRSSSLITPKTKLAMSQN